MKIALSKKRIDVGHRRFLSVRMRAIGALALSLELFLLPVRLLGQEEEGLVDEFAAVSSLQRDELEDEFELLEEQDTVYAAAKHEQDISESPSSITVITHDQIEGSACLDIPCLLSQVPELEVRIVKPIMQSVGARALAHEGSNRALVLIDGRDFTQEALGTTFWGALPLHLADVDRIEVIRGPGSALYGANAHSLVVSITTRQPASNMAEIFFAGGEHNSNNWNARVDHVLGPWSFQVSGGGSADDHWRIRGQNERDLYRATLKVGHEADSSSTKLQLGFLKTDGMFYSSIAPLRVTDLIETNANLVFENSWLRSRLWLDFTSSDMHFDLPLYYLGIKLGTFPQSLPLTTITLDSDTQVQESFFLGNLLLGGMDYRFLYTFMDQNDPQQNYQHRVGIFIQDEQRLWEKFLFTGAVRFDYNSITPFTFSPRLAVSWRFVPGQVLRLSLGRAFRKPSFLESSIHLTSIKGTTAFPELGEFFKRSIGNEDLTSESITVLELGYRGQFFDKRLVLEGDAFLNMYRDNIVFHVNIESNSLGLPDLGKSEVRVTNGGENVNTAGGSLSVTYRIQSAWWINANYTYRYSMYINQGPKTLGTPYENGKRVPWEPAHLFNLTCQYQSSGGLRLALAMHARSSDDFDVTNDGGLFGQRMWVDNPANFYVNALMGWRFQFDQRWLEVGVNAFDLLNRGFVDSPRIIRFDGAEVGGELIGRKVWLYLKGGI